MKNIGFFLTFLGIILLYAAGVHLYTSRQKVVRQHLQVRPPESFAEPSECVTPFGTLLGIANGTPAFSNCRRALDVQWVSYFDFNNPMDISDPQDTTIDMKFMTSRRYSAMDFVMRWMAHNRGLMLLEGGDVESSFVHAHFYNPARIQQTWDADFIANSRKGSTSDQLKYLRPRVGDIVVYARDLKFDLMRPHFAVIVAVENDIEGAGGPQKFKELLYRMVPPRILYLAEQNFDNVHWGEKNYSRIAHFRWEESPTGGPTRGYVDDPSGPRVVGRIRVGKPRPLKKEKSPYKSEMEDDL